MLLTAKLFTLCSFIAIILLEGATSGHALVRRYKFELRWHSDNRLCNNKTMLTINGMYPGPTIYARRGDLVIVDVINHADRVISIHCHGVKLPRNPWHDGPAYVTQCPITPGNKFTQRIQLTDEEGTLWWHAHSEWSRNTVHGAIIILPPKNETYPFPKPHAEVPLLIGEWWNVDIQDVYEEFLHSGADPALCDAFLFNGLPGYNYDACATKNTYKLKVEYGKTYLIRMINTAMNYVMFFAITNHTITVVGCEGSYTKPFRTEYLSIAPGQTIDFLLEASRPRSRYLMAARFKYIDGVSQRYNKIPTVGYVEYIGNYTPPASLQFPPLPPFYDTVASHNITRQLRSLYDRHDVPKNVTVNLLFVFAVNLRLCPNASCDGPGGNRMLASVSNMSLVLPDIPFLDAYYYNISGVYITNFPDSPLFPYNYTQYYLREEGISDPQDSNSVKILEYNSEVELVLQGSDLPVGGMDHPIHFHGYSFFVVGSGFGNWNESSDPANYNLVDPPLMDTVAVPPGGWIAIRFKANNPGVWYFHCHYERHKTWGMGVIFIVKDGKKPNEKMLPPPPDMPPCKHPSTLNSVASAIKDDTSY